MGGTACYNTLVTYPLLQQAPDHLSSDFVDYLRDNNEVLMETEDWIVITNCKYNWPTAITKSATPDNCPLINLYGKYERKVKPYNKHTAQRFRIHIIKPV